MFPHLVKYQYASLDANTILQSPIDCLIGVSDEIKGLLSSGEFAVKTVFDLTVAEPFGEAYGLINRKVIEQGDNTQKVEAHDPIVNLSSIKDKELAEKLTTN